MLLKKKNNIIILSVFLVTTIILVVFSTKVRFDYNFEQFFPEVGDETVFFNEFKENYGSENDFLLVALENKTSIYDVDFLNKVDSISNQLKRLDNIVHVQSPTQMNFYVKESFIGTVFEIPYLHKDSIHLLKKDSVKIASLQSPVKNFFSKNGKALYIMVKHGDQLDDDGAFKLLADVDSVLTKNESKSYLGGRIVGHTYYIDLMQNETVLFVALSVVLLIVFLILTFRSLYGVFIPFVIVASSVIWIVGIMGIFGISLNIVLNIMPTILMVVGISGVVHFLSKYIDKLREGKEKKEAILLTLKQIGKAIFFTSATTIIGFLSLTTSNIPAIIQFGVITAGGVALILIFSLTVLPSILNLMKAPKLKPTKARGTFWDRFLHRFFGIILRKRKLFLMISLIIIGVSVYGTFQIKTNNFIMEDLKSENPLKEGYNYLENNFNGARPFDMNIRVLDTSKNVFDYEVLKEVDKLQSFIERNHQTSILFSPVNVIKEINMTESSGNMEKYIIPEGRKLKKAIRTLEKNKKKMDLSFILTENKRDMRITGTMGDIGSLEAEKKNILLAQYIKDSINVELIEARLTNGPHLMELNNQLLSKNILIGLLVAFLIIGCIIGLMYKSVKMALLSLIPNIIPLLMIGAIMGFFGIDMKISTSLVFTIAFGIAVDDTIHFLSTYKYYMTHGLGKMQALKRTYISTGKAIVLTTLVLSGGFISLAMSDFLGTFYIGLLISLTLMFAVFADLIILPLLIVFFYKPKKIKQLV
jgi:predicted RND superfamily exporter protein